jgi:signal transduction histidine kinase
LAGRWPGQPEVFSRAILNILDDFMNERENHNEMQRAVLNILEDSTAEKAHLEFTLRAILNILEDSAEEKIHLGEIQRAILNILDDFDVERKRTERINLELQKEIAERSRAEDALRRANSAAEAANRELEAFSYSVSHDLRSPLRAIDGFSMAVLEDYAARLDDRGRGYLNRLRSGTQRMAMLIDDMLKLSRVARTEITHEKVNLTELASGICDSLSRSEPGREVDFVISPGLGAHGDPNLLGIAIENLFNNAFKFTGERPRARIEFGDMEEDGARVFFIRDNGAGFDMKYVHKLFGAFQRLHDAREFPGSGIGLATVQRVVHRHGGRIWARGEVGKGASFYFTLPESD